ncbi:MAG TPA: hypothetical protein VEC36_05695 [Patescibacteria group bacterium]|nr:hypothetical protein [Patescibacteria group bacterium]
MPEPRVLLISGARERWSAKDRLGHGTMMNGVEAWAYAFGGDYVGHTFVKAEDIKKYDIVICNTNYHYDILAAEKQLRLAESRPQYTKWVSMIEGCATDYLRPEAHIRELFNASDLVNSINLPSLPLFKKLTSSKVEFIGIPYPVEQIVKLRVDFAHRSKIYICSWMDKRWNDYYVARGIGEKYYVYAKGLSRKIESLAQNWQRFKTLFDVEKSIDIAKNIYNDPQLDVRRMVSMDDYFRHNANALLWLNLDNRYTWARYVLDAAALGIPIITTKSTGHGSELFPETTVENEFGIDEAIQMGKRLLQDQDFYNHVAEFPLQRMEFLKAEPMKKRLLKALNLA